jgi:hypothetical protein
MARFVIEGLNDYNPGASAEDQADVHTNAANKRFEALKEKQRTRKGIAAKATEFMGAKEKHGNTPDEILNFAEKLGVRQDEILPGPGKAIGKVSGWLKGTKNAYQVASLGADRGELGYEAMLEYANKGKVSPELLDRIVDLSKQAATIESKSKEDPYTAKAFGSLAPYMIQSMKEYGKGQMIGRMAGAGVALIGGLAIPAPEEGITLPMAAAMGGQVVGTFMSLEKMRKQEAGSFWLDSVSKGIDPDISGKWAQAYGMGSTVLEAGQLKLLSKIIPGGDKFATNVFGKAMKRTMAMTTAKKVAQPGVAAIGEASVETTQEFLSNVLHIAEAQAMDDLRGTNLSPKTKKAYVNALTEGLIQTFAQTAVGFGIAGLPKGSITMSQAMIDKVRIARLKKALTQDPKKKKQAKKAIEKDRKTPPKPEDKDEVPGLDTFKRKHKDEIKDLKKEEKKVPPVDKKVAKAIKDQPSMEDLKKGEQREPTKEETTAGEKAVEELGLTEKPKQKEPETPTGLSEEAKDFQEEEKSFQQVKKELEERWGKHLKKLPKFSYKDLTQPAVQHKDGSVTKGDKVEPWTPTNISKKKADAMAKSFAKAGKGERGFVVKGKFISSEAIDAKKNLREAVRKKKVAREIAKEKAAKKRAKEDAKAAEAYKNVPDLTAIQKGRLLALEPKIRGTARKKAKAGISYDDVAQAIREAAIKFVRSGKEGGFNTGWAASNFINTQLTKGTAPRTAQQKGEAPIFAELAEDTGTLKRRAQTRMGEVSEKTKQPKTFQQVKLERAIEKREAQLKQAQEKTTKQQDLVNIADNLDKAMRVKEELETGAGAITKEGAVGTRTKEDLKGKADRQLREEREKIKQILKPLPKTKEGVERDTVEYDVTINRDVLSNEIDIDRIGRVIKRVLADAKQSPYYDLITAVQKKFNIKMSIEPTPLNKTAWGDYNHGRRRLRIFPENFMTGKDGRDLSKDDAFIDEVVAHEVLHAVTKEHEAELVPALKPFLKELRKEMKKKTLPDPIKSLLMNKKYNITDEKLIGELISRAFTNPEFAEALASMKVSDAAPTTTKHMWSWLKETIAKVIRQIPGVTTKLDELTAIMDTHLPYMIKVRENTQIDNDTLEMTSLNESDNKKGLIDKKGVGIMKKVLPKAYERLIEGLQVVGDWLDLEAPWKRMNAMTTGRALRTFFSRKSTIQVEGIRMARSFAKMVRDKMGKVTKEEWADIVFQTEDPRHIDTLEINEDRKQSIKEIAEAFNKFFKDMQKRYADRDIKFDWKERMTRHIQEKIRETNNLDDIVKLEKQKEKLAHMNFVHVPVRVLFQNTIDQLTSKKKSDIRKASNILKDLFVSRKRTILSIKDMVERENSPIKKTDIDPIKIMMNYMYRVSEDMAMLDVRDAMLEDGLIKKQSEKKPRKWIATPHSFGVVQGYWVDVNAADTMTNLLTAKVSRSKFDKYVAIIKMSAFYNPFFLPFYDLFQSAASGALVKTGPKTMIKNWGKAFSHVFHQSPEYLEAMKLGLFSKPFEIPWNTFREEMSANLKYGHHRGLMGFLTREGTEFILRSKDWRHGSIFKALYNVSWNTAWKLDEVMRMFTYLQMQKGLNKHSKLSAAETAAQFHGDYASVPPATRRKLNKVFFTPTFKIVMAKVYWRMLKNTIGIPIQLARGKKPLNNAHKRQMAMGALSVVGVNFIIDSILRSVGLEPDDDKWWNFGRRYATTIETIYGQKEFVLTWSNPVNMIQRYAQKIALAWRYDRGNIPKGLLKILHWDFHPLWTTTKSMLDNRKPNGEPIFNNNDDLSVILGKQALFAFTNLIRITQLAGQFIEQTDPVSKQAAKKHLNRVWNKWAMWMVDGPFTIMSTYTRDIKAVRLRRELNRMKRDFRGTQRKHFMKHNKINEKWIENYKKRIRDAIKER